MSQEPGYTLRVIWACMKKDIKSALTERVFTILSIIKFLRVGAGIIHDHCGWCLTT